eukprot:TRINITY_DN682_c0_g1_i1.p1 TRINITY_DN682_c0_g1~~TRINITY_DN682_c0_g1_i1.p1  ORF type:complete len:574 (-),score=145.82 TRINITY_DN682_c0_g1_i1:630-2351(-)
MKFNRKCYLFFLFISLCFSYDHLLRDEEQVDTDYERETNIWAIELEEGTDPHLIAEKHGHDYVECLKHIGNFHVFRMKDGTVHGVTHPPHHHSEEIKWAEQQVEKQRVKRGFIDPLYGEQWHLHPSEPNAPYIDIEGAWEQGITGEGVTIAIVDDGVEYTHPDLAENFRMNSSWDFNYGDSDPFPDSTRDDHGTSAGGVAAAGDNSVCGVGTAYRAGISAIRLISKSSTDVQESAALCYKGNENHIYSNSWGPVDDGKRKEGPGRLAHLALESGIANGRNGLGSLYVWAGGNGRRSRDNCNYDGWANSRYTISIAAADFSGEQAWYSESCSMLIITAPSSGYGSKSITTTDLLGGRGTSRDDCTSTFGGTSAAAPIAAGVVALIVEANRNLTWRDVQAVLIDSAAEHKPKDSTWQRNGAGLMYSHSFGFGLINATRAVAVARKWINLPQNYTHSVISTPNFNFNDNDWHNISIQVTDEFVVEHNYIFFKAQCSRRGDLLIKLISPSGTQSYLTEEHGDNARDYDWRFGSIVNWGESSLGEWTLSVRDVRNPSLGVTIDSVDFTFFGHKEVNHG